MSGGFHITGARVLCPEGLAEGPLGIAGGRIVDGMPGRALALDGLMVLPGIVDTHGDGFERHLAPRRGAVRDLGRGLIAAEAELAANGITTAVLAQFWSWEGGMRSPDFALAMLEALAEVRPRVATALLAQLRFETHLLGDYDRFAGTVERHGVPYVVFNDHVPHAALAAGKRPPRLTGQALKSGRSPEAHLDLLRALHARTDEVPAALATLAGRLAGQGVLLGSHDDPDALSRARWAALGALVAEFPTSLAAARAAEGAPVVMGAPNVLRGGSHSDGVDAREVVMAGLCTALASDYHYPAPRLAALSLAAGIGIERAWALVSSGPAGVLGLTDRGRLEPGARADLVVIDPADGRVGLTVAGGRVSYMSAPVAEVVLDGSGG